MNVNFLKFCYFLIAFLSISFITNGQWYDPAKIGKKANALNEKAYEAAIDGKYAESLSFLGDALKADPKFLDVYLSRAGVYATIKDYKSSVEDFRTAFQLDSIYSSTYLLPYSISLAGIGDFKDALVKVNSFLQTPKLNDQSIQAGKYRKRTYEFALNYLREHSDDKYVFSPFNLGSNINTAALEYFPSLTIDGKKLIFTRREKGDEDFYESDLQNDGTWGMARPLSGRINTNLNEGAQTISQDGQWLIYTGCNYPEGQGRCDIYIAYKLKDGSWSTAENMTFNTEYWESSPSLSPDKLDLYFASNNAAGFGGRDLWVTRRQPNGKWATPVNLGPEINTPGDEGSPFIHADNQTLYFSSNYHDGYGATDLFLSKKTDSGWSKPLNLGYPINTIDDEGSLIVTADGKTGYYASERQDTKGGLDLYSFKLPENVQALKTLWVRGKVFDAKTKEGLPSSLLLTDINTRKEIFSIQTDEEGNYLVTLPEGKDYAFNVGRKGYLFYYENFSLKNPETDSSFLIDIPLQAIETGASVILKNIFFDVNKSTLKPSSVSELDKVVNLMTDNPKLKLSISGHTDNTGASAENLILSRERAKSVVSYLISKGIKKERLTYEGFGEKKPVDSNVTEEGKSHNRRTEIYVISNK
ncbi:MAG: OmpA family protein [Ferruginibacter sp.]